MKHIRFIVFSISLLSIAVLSVNFSFMQDNFISVVGKAVYNTREYPTQRVQVQVTEDGRDYKTFYCDEKGRFESKVKLNHKYVFNFSMDYHATSKVLVDTKVPDNIAQGNVGGLFSFDCEMFERIDGLNLSILNNPLVKIKFNPEKNDFQYDKEYTEKILFNLEGFREQLAEMKQRRKQVLKDAAVRETNVASQDEEKNKPERKPIVFEDPKPKKAVNKRGHRNILDLGTDDDQTEEEEPTEALASEEVKDTVKEPLASSAKKAVRQDPTAIEAEDLYLEEEIDESEFVSLNVIPKRVEIKTQQKAVVMQEEDRELEAAKQKMQALVEVKRVAEEKKIKEEVTSFNFRSYKQKEMHLTNKKIQTQRLSSLIKAVALAEVYYKKEYYKRNPINHNHFIPTIVRRSNSGFWKDREEVLVKYPGSTVSLKKVTYLFGLTFYYRNDEEIDEKVYCSAISNFTSNKYHCVQ